jgi:tRNA U34 5-carboxymethylaminomethyl modifying GTPase MnmE/TrmE
LSAIRDASGAELDHSIVVRYDAPASFTGEDAGRDHNPRWPRRVDDDRCEGLIARGARLALPESSRAAPC